MKFTKKELYKSIENSSPNNDIYAMPKTYYDYATENELTYKCNDKHRNGYEYVYIHANDDSIYWLDDDSFHNKFKLVK